MSDNAKQASKEAYSIYQAIPLIMGEMSAIGKTKKNQSQGFFYRGIDDLYNELHPLLAKYGVFTVPKVISETTEDRITNSNKKIIYRVLKIKYKFMASDGSYVTATVIGEGMDSGDKAANKAMSIAHKYALFQVFAVATEDLIDPDSEEIGPTSKEKKNEDKKSAIKPKPVDNAVPSKNGKADSKPTEEAPKPPVKAKEETGNQNPPTGTKPVQSGADTTGSGVGELFQYVIGVINGAPKSGFVAKDAIPWMREVNTAKKTDDMKLMEELVKRLNEYLEADTEKKNEIMADLNQLPIF